MTLDQVLAEYRQSLQGVLRNIEGLPRPYAYVFSA